MKRKKITCVVSDARSLAVAERLASLGGEVTVCGGERWMKKCSLERATSLKSAVVQGRILVLPTPAFDGDARVRLDDAEVGESARELFDLADAETPIFAGRVGESEIELARRCGITLVDYMQMEEVQWRNAIPTAEGALCLAMQRLDITLKDAHVAVLGYGRIATALCERLQALGAKVTAAARKPRDVVRMELAGYRALHIKDERSLLPLTAGYDVIFNTVPHRLLTPLLMERMHPKTLLVELASAPGGWDPATVVGDRAIYAPGLPGVYAPRTAGDIIARAIFSAMKEGTV